MSMSDMGVLDSPFMDMAEALGWDIEMSVNHGPRVEITTIGDPGVRYLSTDVASLPGLLPRYPEFDALMTQRETGDTCRFTGVGMAGLDMMKADMMKEMLDT